MEREKKTSGSTTRCTTGAAGQGEGGGIRSCWARCLGSGRTESLAVGRGKKIKRPRCLACQRWCFVDVVSDGGESLGMWRGFDGQCRAVLRH